jgi:hypothetical protein
VGYATTEIYWGVISFYSQRNGKVSGTSMIVDLPDPLSSTKKVTSAVNPRYRTLSRGP